jgi:hypothetical protein
VSRAPHDFELRLYIVQFENFDAGTQFIRAQPIAARRAPLGDKTEIRNGLRRSPFGSGGFPGTAEQIGKHCRHWPCAGLFMDKLLELGNSEIVPARSNEKLGTREDGITIRGHGLRRSDGKGLAACGVGASLENACRFAKVFERNRKAMLFVEGRSQPSGDEKRS